MYLPYGFPRTRMLVVVESTVSEMLPLRSNRETKVIMKFLDNRTIIFFFIKLHLLK